MFQALIYLLTSLHQTNGAETQCRFAGEGAVKRLLEQRLSALILQASTMRTASVFYNCLCFLEFSYYPEFAAQTRDRVRGDRSDVRIKEKAKVRQGGKSKKER